MGWVLLGPIKGNQKMAFFGFEMDFFSGFQYQFGLEHEFWKAGFSISGLEPKFGNPSFDTPEKQHVSIFS